MAIQQPAEGALARKADFDRNGQPSLSSGRGLRRATAPTVKGGCARDTRPGAPDRSKAAPVGRPARTGWEGPEVLPRRHCTASTLLNFPSPVPQCDHACLRRIPADTRKATGTPLPAGETRTRFRCASRLRPPSAAPDITRTGRRIRHYRPSHPLEIEARTAAVLPTSEVRREMNTRPGLRAPARAELSIAARLQWAGSRHSKRPCSRPSRSSTSPPSVRERSPQDLTRVRRVVAGAVLPGLFIDQS